MFEFFHSGIIVDLVLYIIRTKTIIFVVANYTNTIEKEIVLIQCTLHYMILIENHILDQLHGFCTYAF